MLIKKFTPYTLIKKDFFFCNYIKKFFSEEKKDNDYEGTTITIDTHQPSEKTETEMEEAQLGTNIKISDIYNIKSKKMAPPNIHSIIDKTKFENNNVRLRNFIKDEFKNVGREEDRKYIPVSPRLGPFEILDPKLEGKTYHWCSCGMSKKQPFCDMSHRNSKLRPVSFKLGEKCNSMLLCGCKLSKTAPFCDGKTCVTLKAKQDEELNSKIEQANKH